MVVCEPNVYEVPYVHRLGKLVCADDSFYQSLPVEFIEESLPKISKLFKKYHFYTESWIISMSWIFLAVSVFILRFIQELSQVSDESSNTWISLLVIPVVVFLFTSVFVFYKYVTADTVLESELKEFNQQDGFFLTFNEKSILVTVWPTKIDQSTDVLGFYIYQNKHDLKFVENYPQMLEGSELTRDLFSEIIHGMNSIVKSNNQLHYSLLFLFLAIIATVFLISRTTFEMGERIFFFSGFLAVVILFTALGNFIYRINKLGSQTEKDLVRFLDMNSTENLEFHVERKDKTFKILVVINKK